jgi:hypothetical protein
VIFVIARRNSGHRCLFFSAGIVPVHQTRTQQAAFVRPYWLHWLNRVGLFLPAPRLLHPQ